MLEKISSHGKFLYFFLFFPQKTKEKRFEIINLTSLVVDVVFGQQLIRNKFNQLLLSINSTHGSSNNSPVMCERILLNNNLFTWNIYSHWIYFSLIFFILFLFQWISIKLIIDLFASFKFPYSHEAPGEAIGSKRNVIHNSSHFCALLSMIHIFIFRNFHIHLFISFIDSK